MNYKDYNIVKMIFRTLSSATAVAGCFITVALFAPTVEQQNAFASAARLRVRLNTRRMVGAGAATDDQIFAGLEGSDEAPD